MKRTQLLAGTIAAVVAAALIQAQPQAAPEPSGRLMAQAAAQFLASLSPEQRQQAVFAYDDEERLNWHFIPRPRKGLPLKEMTAPQAAAAHGLLKAGLSEAGYEQIQNVMSLEEILYLLETGDRAARRDRRDPLKYYLSIFGTPATNGTWGWRVEGHHVSLNFTIRDGRVVASTPEFFGANPGAIDAGPGRTLRVLAKEEDLARQILHLGSEDQKKVAWIDKKAPDDVRGGGAAQPVVDAPKGLSRSRMNADQKELLDLLLAEYLQNMPADVAAARRAEIMAAGLDQIHFAWWGGSELNEPHHYVVQGPTFIIEYNNTQNSANHVHSMWRNIAGDFAKPRP